MSLPPPASRARPGARVVDGAEGVRDAVLAAMADQRHADVPERGSAMRAGLERRLERRRLVGRPWLPVAAVEGPRDDVLEPAEDRAALARRLGHPEPVLAVDVRAAPGAAFPLSHRMSLPLRPWISS